MPAATTVDDLLDRYEDAATIGEAEAALEAIAALPEGRASGVGDYFEELAEIAVEGEGDYGTAVRLQRRAVEHGSEYPTLSREQLAWYLLKDGQTVAGEAEFDALRNELGADPRLLVTIGMARGDAGRERDALTAFDEALAAAKLDGDPELLAEARRERRFSREQLGLPPDEDDRMAALDSARASEPTVYTLGWFPRDEREAALARWPDLAEDLEEPDAYCRMIEQRLRDMHLATGQHPFVAPLRVAALTQFAADRKVDSGDAQIRAHFAAELHRRDETISWPPGRNDPCWCGSQRKYKRCCGQA